jgi:hypothetical protein
VDDHAGAKAFLATSQLKLSTPVTNVAALVQAGEECVVRVIDLRPGHTRAVLMVELAGAEYIQTLEARLAHRATASADGDGLCE